MGIQPTNAGIDFQQRVSAWFMLNMLFDIKLNNSLSVMSNEKIIEIASEAKEEIDDLVIKTESGKKIYMQMKRSISLSTEASSEFYSVCSQFVKQYLKNYSNDIAYILVTSHNASRNICEVLRKVLDSIRTSNSFSVVGAFNKKEKDAYEKVKAVIEEIYAEITQDILSEKQLLSIFKKMYIDILDIENNQGYEKIVKMLLNTKSFVEADLIWSYMIKLALNLAANRQVITKKYLKDNLKQYLKGNSEESKDRLEKRSFQTTYETDSFEMAKDYILAFSNEEIDKLFNVNEQVKESKRLYLMELDRFDSDGNKKLDYISPNKVILVNGIELDILCRSATQLGIERFINSDKFGGKYSEYSLIVIQANKNGGNVEKQELHKEYLKRCWEEKKEVKCLNCGSAIFQEETFICELDDKEVNNDMGMIHKECLLPVNRVLGVAKMPAKEDYSYLKNFNINLWIDKIRKGQYFSGELQNFNQEILQMVVETKNVFDQGNYMVKVYLENDTFRYLTDKGNIDRFSSIEAQQFVISMNSRIKEGNEEKNPWCYSSESYTFGRYQNLVSMFGGKEDYLECLHSEVVKYNDAVASLYSQCDNFYAPLIYLTIDDRPITIDGVFPLFTNPLEIKTYIKNWNKVGIKVESFNVNIINDDNEFRLRIIELLEEDIRPIANMKIGKNGELISGIIFYTMKEIEEGEKVDNADRTVNR